jgi:deazaflavin-dependent oxidoreductase (nitroreductase family)
MTPPSDCTTIPASPARLLPRWVPWFNAVARRLLAAGIPMGPDVLLTVRGRRTGLPRTTPVTICEHAGRRGLISPFGETHWVRNLRVSGRATISVFHRREEVVAIELRASMRPPSSATCSHRRLDARGSEVGSCGPSIRSTSTTLRRPRSADRSFEIHATEPETR